MTRYLLELQEGIIYGPINSRRLGSSLGLNILPTQYKACPFNCAYCQYGFTRAPGFTTEPDNLHLPEVEEVAKALEDALDEYPTVSYITFSGNGESTLHPDFSRIIDAVREVKSRMAPDARLAILSNSALVFREHVRDALSKLDVRFMKLDVGDGRIFQRFNRPHKNIDFDDVVAGLKQIKGIIIQTLFAGGEHGNYDDSSIEKWIEKIGEINPIECHIYSIDRPSADNKLTLIDKEGLLKIKTRTEKVIKIPVKVF